MYHGRIHILSIPKKLNVKFTAIIKDDLQSSPYKYSQDKNKLDIIKEFNYMGTDYLDVDATRSFVTIQLLTKDRNDSWTNVTSVTIPRFGLYKVIRAFQRIKKGFSTENLFYKRGPKLELNQDIASTLKEEVYVKSKSLLVEYTVVEDELYDGMEFEYEGVLFCINSYDNFCYLSYEEFCYILHELESIDFNSLTMQCVQAYLLKTHPQLIKTQVSPSSKIFSEKKEKEYKEVIPGQKESVIPKI